MKITNNSLCYIIESDTMKRSIINHCLNVKRNSKSYGESFLSDVQIFNTTHHSERILVLTSKVKNIIDKCKIDVEKDFRFDVLRTLPNRLDIIQVDENTCFKYIKNEYSIYVQFFREDRIKDQIYVSEFFVSLINEDGQQYVTSSLNVRDEDMDLFLRVITFIELTDVTLKFILPKESKGNVMKGDFIKNSSNNKIILVNTNWNVRVIRLGTIDVSGHFRLQPYGGVNNRYYKYIFIEPYTKGLLRRLPQKELVD